MPDNVKSCKKINEETAQTAKFTTKQSKLEKSMWGQSHVIGPEGIGDISPLLPKRQKYQDLEYDV